MKKKISFFFPLILIALALCILGGCGGAQTGTAPGEAEAAPEESADLAAASQDREDEVKETDKEMADNSPEDGGKEDAEPDYEAEYAPVLDAVLAVIKEGYDFEKEYKYISGGLTEKIMYTDDDDLMEAVGYRIEDINGDGVSELLIGCTEQWEGVDPESCIFSIYTLINDKPECVLEGWARNSFYRLENGHIFNIGSGGAAVTIFGECHLGVDGRTIVWDDFYFTDEKTPQTIGMYHNTTGIFDAKVSEELSISEDDFWAIRAGYEEKRVLIEWTPIGSYKAGGRAGASGGHSFSYEGTIFSIDGKELDVRDEIALTDSIMDAKRVGDWVILDCHVNPHVSVYEFYNVNSGAFEYDLEGACLTWQGDDLSTAVYSAYDRVYDLWGHLIGWVDEGEIFGLEWTGPETVEAKCLVFDGAGNEKEYTKEFEYSPDDRAVLSYYEYMLGGKREWDRFKEEAPEDAAALLMVNPPQRILDKLPAPVVVDEGTGDRVVMVSLRNEEKFGIEAADKGFDAGPLSYQGTEEAGRGQAVVYAMTVPEGIPTATMVIRTPGQDEVRWDVATLSGRAAVISRFL